MEQILPPGVEYGEEADLSTQVLGVGGDDLQCFRSGPEENAVNGFSVLKSDGGNLFRHRENNMEIIALEKLRFSFLDPLRSGQRLALGTVTV